MHKTEPLELNGETRLVLQIGKDRSIEFSVPYKEPSDLRIAECLQELARVLIAPEVEDDEFF